MSSGIYDPVPIGNFAGTRSVVVPEKLIAAHARRNAFREVADAFAVEGRAGMPEDHAPGMTMAGRIVRGMVDAAESDYAAEALRFADSVVTDRPYFSLNLGEVTIKK